MGDIVADAMLDRAKCPGVTTALHSDGGLRPSHLDAIAQWIVHRRS